VSLQGDGRQGICRASKTPYQTYGGTPGSPLALADLGEVLELAGRRDEAAGAHRSAIELHERKGNVLAANQTRGRLDNLSD
jgi:hypothetical protein